MGSLRPTALIACLVLMATHAAWAHESEEDSDAEEKTENWDDYI